MNPSVSHGSCLCGAVSFDVKLPPKWVAHCHCTLCRRAHGAAFVTWVGVEAGTASIADPGSSLHWYQSSPGGRRGFCSTCGSPMFFESIRWPGELHIARALFTDAVGQEPQVHAYHDTHVSWVFLADDLPRKDAPKAG